MNLHETRTIFLVILLGPPLCIVVAFWVLACLMFSVYILEGILK